jgi:hypothetical protein
MLRWALRAIVFQAVHRQRDELLLCAGISNTQGEWTAVLGLTEGSLSEIHQLSYWEAKRRIMRRVLWAYLLPLLDGFREARKRSQETGRFPRGGVEERPVS